MVKRYDCDMGQGMYESKTGNFVLAEDYEKCRKQLITALNSQIAWHLILSDCAKDALIDIGRAKSLLAEWSA
jgi:hypothetical protein